MAKTATPKSRTRRKAVPDGDQDSQTSHGADVLPTGADQPDTPTPPQVPDPVPGPSTPDATPVPDVPAEPAATVIPDAAAADPSPSLSPSPAEGPPPQADPGEPASSQPVPPPAAPLPARSAPSVIWPALGALIGAGAGAALIWVMMPVPAPVPDLGVLERRFDALEARLAAPRTDLTVEDLTQALAPVQDRLIALEGAVPVPVDLSGVDARLDALAGRMDAIEAGVTARVRDSVTEALAAGQSRDDARAQARAAEIAAAQAELAATEARIARRAALAELTTAAQTGTAAPQALAALGDVPAALAPLAQGLPTLAALQASYPPAARAALAALPPPADAPLSERMLGFLRSQTGARSLAPRPGDDADAVLARAEAALRGGDLPTALTELSALPAPAAAAMADWQVQAERRAGALSALDALRAELD